MTRENADRFDSIPETTYRPVPVGEVKRSALLGHANVGITATVYCHMLPNADRQAVRQLDELTAEPAGVTDLALARARLRGGSQGAE